MYEYTAAKNLKLFIAGENYSYNNRVKFGLSLDFWSLFTIRFGLEGRSSSARAFVG